MTDKILIYLVYLLFFFFIIGPLGEIPLELTGVNIYLIDPIIGLLAIFWIVKLKTAIKLLKKDKITHFFLIFVFTLFLSWLFTPIQLNWSEKLISLLYLVRLLAYFAVYLTFLYLSTTGRLESLTIKKILFLSGMILAGFGWFQYFLYPDLRNLYYLGWDPHNKRIFSTYFDPNFFGLIMIIMFILLLVNFQKKIMYFLSAVFIFLTILFTYSRSSFITLLVVLMIDFINIKKYWLLGVIVIIFASLLILLPRSGGESVKLERMFSIEQRIINLQENLMIFSKNPLFGTGFNTLRYARRDYGLADENWLESHAGAGADNSFIFVLATSGLIGLTIFIIMLVQFFLHVGFMGRLILISILIDSLFINSFFYSWMMFILWIILAIERKKILKPLWIIG